MMKLISSKIDERDAKWKKRSALSYRYIIAKGREHMEKCVPRAEMLEENFQKALHVRNNQRLKYWLQQKHQKIWDRFVEEVGWKP